MQVDNVQNRVFLAMVALRGQKDCSIRQGQKNTKMLQKHTKIHNGIKKETHNRCKAKRKKKKINNTMEVEKKAPKTQQKCFLVENVTEQLWK